MPFPVARSAQPDHFQGLRVIRVMHLRLLLVAQFTALSLDQAFLQSPSSSYIYAMNLIGSLVEIDVIPAGSFFTHLFGMA